MGAKLSKVGKLAKKAKAIAEKSQKVAEKAKNKKWLGKWIRFLLEHDCDFDYDAILDLLVFKLGLMADFFEKHGHALGSTKRAKEMRKVADLLAKVAKDDYYWDLCEPFRKKYGEPEIKWESLSDEECKKSDANPGELTRMLTFYKGKLETEEMKKEQHKLFMKADRMRQADLKRAFDLMTKRLFWWWD